MRLSARTPASRALALAVSAGLITLAALSACGPDAASTPPAGTGATTAAAAPAGPTFKACTALPVEAVGALLGGTVTTREVPGGGCQFNQDDPRAASINVADGVPADQGGGLPASKVGAATQIDGTPEDVAGVGDGAYIVVGKGKVIPTESIQAAGGLVVKGQLITVVLAQGQGLPADKVSKLIKDVLALIATKA